MELKRQLGLITAILVIVADMVGTGIFITTGSVLGMTRDAFLILILWGVGGAVALTGSLCYAELSTMWPDVGGEYVYLRNTFGPLPSFLTGWISLVVGFSAPVATGSLTLVQYLYQFSSTAFDPGSPMASMLAGVWSQKLLAACIILFFGFLHIIGVKRGSRIQNVLTILKILVVVSLIGCGAYMADWAQAGRLTAGYSAPGAPGAGLPVIGLALLIIMFSYSGWNCAAYLSGEIERPERNLPRALFFGTLITTMLYLGINVIYLLSSPGNELMGQEAVGAIAARSLFGVSVSHLFTLGIAFILLSSISVQIMVGPRVYYAMAKDRMIFQALSRISPRFETPALSISIQVVLAVVYVFLGNARVLMEYMGFALGVFPVLTVIGLVYLRHKRPDIPRPYRVPFYPIVPAVYILLSAGMMVAALMAWTKTSLFAIAVIAAGIPVFYLWRWYAGRKTAVS